MIISWDVIRNSDNPQKTGGIEIYNTSEYLKIRTHWNGCGLLLHEICHIIHQFVLKNGLENDQVIAAYNHVVRSGKYDHVLRYVLVQRTTYPLSYHLVDIFMR
jgi:hypothetical protein